MITEKFLHVLATAVVVLQLSGCTLFGATQNCKVLDPDLAQGVYSGGFRAGMKHGKGIKKMPNGDRYAGWFSDDYRHGKGVYVCGEKTQWAGDSYGGEYQRDLRHGWGLYRRSNGDRYEGSWQDDLRMGMSVMELRRAQAAEAAAQAAKAK